MPDVYDAVKRSDVMRKVRGRDTKPEILVRQTLHRAGFRFRIHRRDLPGRPDIVLPKYHAAIFVHGCFWHGHPSCPHAARPMSNVDYWRRKLDRNIERDASNMAALRQAGWHVIVLWECEIRTHAQAEEMLNGVLFHRSESAPGDQVAREDSDAGLSAR